MNRGSRRESAHSTVADESQSLLTSAATRFMERAGGGARPGFVLSGNFHRHRTGNEIKNKPLQLNQSQLKSDSRVILSIDDYCNFVVGSLWFGSLWFGCTGTGWALSERVGSCETWMQSDPRPGRNCVIREMWRFEYQGLNTGKPNTDVR